MTIPRLARALVGAVALVLIGGCASTTASSGESPSPTTTPSDGRATPTAAPSDVPDVGTAVPTLAKMQGGRQGLHRASMPGEADFAVLELAYDEAGVRALWSAAVPEGLSASAGIPLDFGIYGAVEDVDLDEQVVGLWSSGQSSSCRHWLGSVDGSDHEAVALVEVGQVGICTADIQLYSQVVVLDRDQVPPAAALPLTGELTFSAFTDATQSPGNGQATSVLITAFAG